MPTIRCCHVIQANPLSALDDRRRDQVEALEMLVRNGRQHHTARKSRLSPMSGMS